MSSATEPQSMHGGACRKGAGSDADLRFASKRWAEPDEWTRRKSRTAPGHARIRRRVDASGSATPSTRSNTIDDASIGLSVFSPPFPGMYVYSDDPADMGNVTSIGEMVEGFGHLAGRMLPEDDAGPVLPDSHHAGLRAEATGRLHRLARLPRAARRRDGRCRLDSLRRDNASTRIRRSRRYADQGRAG